jgi:hypothetical protein
MKTKTIFGHVVLWLVINYLLLDNFSDFGEHSNSVESLSSHINDSNNMPTGIIVASFSYLVIGLVLINKYFKKINIKKY